MLDIKFIRENKDLIKIAAQKKHVDFSVEALLKSDDSRRELLMAVEAKRAEQNTASEKIAKAATPEERNALIAEMKVVKDTMQKEEEKLKKVMVEWQGLMLQVPNIPDMSVPEGNSDADNKEVKVSGEKPKFDFTPKNHIELMEALDIADFEKGTEVAGFRGYFLKGDGAMLNFAIWQFVLDFYRTKRPEFIPMLAPALVRRETLLGTGYLPQGEEDLYRTQDNEYLSGTAEVGAMSYFADKVLPITSLPQKVLAFSTAFRREAGSHSKDTKGLIRVHEFHKFEQIIICEANHETSVKHHEELLANSEEMLQMLGLPYHVVVNCAGDLGLGQVKKYDIEAWVPSQNTYRETHSCSYFHDFQTRRLNLKYKDAEGKTRFAHSLNNTALATPRLLVPLIENNQQADGSIKIPEVLQKYMGKTLITKKA
ncbi:MAG: serine--tRNA ligase [Candidatus Paceibacterota bacterium]